MKMAAVAGCGELGKGTWVATVHIQLCLLLTSTMPTEYCNTAILQYNTYVIPLHCISFRKYIMLQGERMLLHK